MERLKHMKESLMSCVEGQISGNLQNVDTEELGDAIDMIKDLSEAIYYCTITKAMEEKDTERRNTMYFYERPYQYPGYTEYVPEDRMYYGGGTSSSGRGSNNGNSNSGGNSGNSSYYHEPMMMREHGSDMGYTNGMRDVREGRSPVSRRMYMETKASHKDSPARMKELEQYLKELAQDITEMIEDSSPEEKAMLQQKLSTLINKIK